MKRLDVTTLEIEGFNDGSVKVACWCKCYTAADVDDVIEWLKLGKMVMERWAEIRKAEP
jgi:hypothetical protein